MSVDNPATLSSILGDFGTLPEITYAGKTWKIGKPTQRAKEALEAIVVTSAWAEIKKLKTIDPDLYEEAKSEHLDAINNQEYATWGRRWVKGTSGFVGGVRLLCAYLRERHPEATVENAMELIVNCPDDVKEALTRTVPPFSLVLVESHPAVVAASPEKKEEIRQQAIPMIQKVLSQLASLTPETPSPETASS